MRFILGIALLTLSSHASAVVIDFDDQPFGTPGALAPTIESDGFLFDFGLSVAAVTNFASSYASDMDLTFFAGGIAGAPYDDNDDSLLVTRADGGSFIFNSADVWFGGDTAYGDYVDIIGHAAGGGTINSQWVIGGFEPWLEPHTLGAFSGEELVALEIVFTGTNIYDSPIGTGIQYYVDDFNVTASVVPVPAAVWLFGSALLGLGWLRRKLTS